MTSLQGMSNLVFGKRNEICSTCIILFFLFKCITIGNDIKYGVLPDERMHVATIEGFYNADTWLVNPKDMGPTQAAATSQDKFLYHLILGKSAKALSLNSNRITFYRGVSVLFSLLTVLVFWRTAIEVFGSSFLQVVSLILFTNILMFTAVSISISYDTLTNLIGAVIIWQLVKFAKKPSVQSVLIIFIFIATGFLVKTSILPFLPIALTIIAFRYKKILGRRLKDLRRVITPNTVSLVLFLLLIVSGDFIIANKNYKNYGKILNVSCSHIYNGEICKENNGIYRWYSELRKTNYNSPRVSLIEYFDTWNDLMIERTFGLAAHNVMLLGSGEYMILKGLLILVFFGMFLCFKQDHFFDNLWIYSSYTFVVLLYVNYNSYMSHGELLAGVHGRYLFPVISAGIILLTQSLHQLSKNIRIPKLLPVLACILFFFLDYPSFIMDKNYYDVVNKIPKHEVYKGPLAYFDKPGSAIHIDTYNSVPLVNDTIVAKNDEPYVKIEGWAFDNYLKREAEELIFRVNDGLNYKAKYGLKRPDLAKGFNNKNLLKTGFLFYVDRKLLSDVNNELSLIILSKEDKIYSEKDYVIRIEN